MTSSPTPAVLPDARAQEIAIEMAAFEAAFPLCDHTKYRDGEVIAGRVRYAEPDMDRMFSAWISARATLPSSDVAARPRFVLVPVEPTFEMKMAGAKAITAGHMRDAANFDAACDAWPAMLAAAPKVASDTGAKLSDDDAIIAEFAFLYREYGLADDATLAPDAIGLKRKVLAALATDATDGATSGGELRSELRSTGGVCEATTPGGDLLEQAARTERSLSWVIAEAKRTLRLVQGCMECNADDERRWSETIEWLERLA